MLTDPLYVVSSIVSLIALTLGTAVIYILIRNWWQDRHRKK